ncbi:MAG: sigma-70 family RNA polymerase sigma factor [bacterium]|nr:sigma-70 family RNA polymerase sigma factor [bacterium]
MRSGEENHAGRRSEVRDSEDERAVRELIIRCKTGDTLAFAELMQRYRKQVASLAYRITNDYDEAADITQAVFVKMAANLGRFDENRKFYTWLYRITVNCAIDHLRKTKRFRHESLESYNDKLESLAENPETLRNRELLVEYIRQATLSLNTRQRSAFVLRDMEGCRVDDVAVMLDVPEATVRWYLHRARTKIRKDLLRRCPQLLMLFGIR